MDLSDILLLGDPRLYEPCGPVKREELPELRPVAQEMADLVRQFREKYGAGRAIAAPQVGVLKRLIVLNIDRPVAMYNPVLSDLSSDMIELWDDCMSFPNLLVRLQRHRSCTLTFRDDQWHEQQWPLKDDLSELLQHECDHLNGTLAISRALDAQSFRWRPSENLPQKG